VTRLFLRLVRWCARFTDRIITLTERGRREHLDFGVGLPEKYSVIPSGIPLENFFPDPGRGRQARERLGIPPEAPVLGTVGRLTAVKDQRTLILAAKILKDRHPDLVVLLIGDGGLKGKLEAQTRDLGLEGCIRFLGWESNVPELLNALDVFVLCSLNEGMGRALFEAMASGLPVVATNVGGCGPWGSGPGRNRRCTRWRG
jgi:glycosyltransferase involved in cell wall biosynthesis